ATRQRSAWMGRNRPGIHPGTRAAGDSRTEARILPHRRRRRKGSGASYRNLRPRRLECTVPASRCDRPTPATVDGRQDHPAAKSEAVRMNAIPARKLEHEAARRAKRLRHQVGQAIADFNMVEDGDRVMVCLSGGKDSWTLLDILAGLREKAPVRFELVAVHLDQKQPGYDAEVMPRYLRARGLPFHVLEQDTYSVVRRVIPEGRT